MKRALTAIAIGLVASQDVLACGVCYGDPNSPMTQGVNNGIIALLVVIGAVQVGFVALFWKWRQRTRELERMTAAIEDLRG